MTLKEQLDAKVKRDSAEALKNEIAELFLNAPLKALKKGMTIEIFYNTPDTIFYIIGGGYMGSAFEGIYDESNLRDAIPLIRKEGIEVNDEVKDHIYMTYRVS